MPIAERLGGRHHGCFLPDEGVSDQAYALFSFESLARYEAVRAAFPEEPGAADLMTIAQQSGCVRRYDRTFLRRVSPTAGAPASP